VAQGQGWGQRQLSPFVSAVRFALMMAT
jgi:hypothetical protein